MASDDGGSNELQSQQTGGIGSSEPGLGESQFNGRLMYPSQQQPVATYKGILSFDLYKNFFIFKLHELGVHGVQLCHAWQLEMPSAPQL
jgi:hypothetical protein